VSDLLREVEGEESNEPEELPLEPLARVQVLLPYDEIEAVNLAHFVRAAYGEPRSHFCRAALGNAKGAPHLATTCVLARVLHVDRASPIRVRHERVASRLGDDLAPLK
jgi:hypothetical protein